MKTKDIKDLLIILNSNNNTMGRYPIGNKELTIKTRQLESDGKIWFDAVYKVWRLRGGSVDFRRA